MVEKIRPSIALINIIHDAVNDCKHGSVWTYEDDEWEEVVPKIEPLDTGWATMRAFFIYKNGEVVARLPHRDGLF